MAAIDDRTRHSHRVGEAPNAGVPLTGRTLVLFAGMVLTGSVTIGLITAAVASLLVPDNQIGVRPYLVSSLPAVLMLFIAIVPALEGGRGNIRPRGRAAGAHTGRDPAPGGGRARGGRPAPTP
jgi:hypothetical protein